MRIKWRAYRRGEPSLLGKMALRLLLVACVMTTILPFAWMVSTSLKDERAFQRDPSGWLPRIPPYRTHGELSIDRIYATTQDFEDILLDDFETPQGRLKRSASAARAGHMGLVVPYRLRWGQQVVGRAG